MSETPHPTHPTNRGTTDAPLVFIHIPKTAGTTLWLILRRQYSPSAVVRRDDYAPVGTLTPRERQDMRVLLGHFPYGVGQDLPGDAAYITVLREPLERILSSYSHIVRDHRAQHGEAVPDLRDHLTSGFGELDNLQTRLLAGREALALPFGQVDREVFDLATSNITCRITVAGLTERFDEAAVMLQRRLGWKMPCYVHENVGTNRIHRDQVPRDILGAIWRQTRWDRALYAFAAAHFEAQVALEGPAFTNDLRRFRIANIRYKRMKALVGHGPLSALKSRLPVAQQMWMESAVRSVLGGVHPATHNHPAPQGIPGNPDREHFSVPRRY